MVTPLFEAGDVRLIHSPSSQDNKRFIIEAGQDGVKLDRATLLELAEAMLNAALDFPVSETKCAGCKADMQWITTERGNMAPCDVKKVTIVTPGGKYQVGFTSHFATCPNADDFRQRAIVCTR